MPEDTVRQIGADYRRYIILTVIALSILITLFVNVYLGIDTVYTHFYYIPIILTGIWYYRKAILLAILLGASHIMIGFWLTGSVSSTLVRAAMFIIVAIVVSYLSESRDRLYNKVKSSEHNLNVIINSVYDGIIIHDVEGRIVNINERMLAMYRVTREEALRQTIEGLSGPGNPLDTMPALWRKVMAGEEQLFEWVARRPADSTTFYAEMYLKRVVLDGKPYIMATVRDIDLRKQAEEEKLRLARYIELLLESTDEGILGEDTEGRCTIINKSALQMIGYTAEEVRGKAMHDLIHYRKPDGTLYPREECCIYQSVKTGAGCRVSGEVFWRKDGTAFPVEYSSYPLAENGMIKGSVITFADITERQRAEREVQEARRQAEMYLDLMGHDINNMNQIGIGYLEEALETMKIGDDERFLLTKPLQALYNSTQLIENVRKLQAIKEGCLKLKPIDVGSALQEVVSRYSHVPDRDVIFNYRAPAGCTVMANDLLKDVFSNIVGNAIKHSEGTLNVDIGVEKIEADSRKCCRVTIDDNGPGISDDVKGKLFSRFQRGTTRASGKGLGLYLVRTLVESYHGCVRVEDRVPGDHTKGARFVIELPSCEK